MPPTDFLTTIVFTTLSVCGLDYPFTIAIALGAPRLVSTPSSYDAWLGIAILQVSPNLRSDTHKVSQMRLNYLSPVRLPIPPYSHEVLPERPSGSFEDWVELYNPGPSVVQLSGYYLTDDLSNPGKWALPDTQLQAGGYLLIWTDNDDEEGSLHTNFALSKNGEELGLFYKDVLSWSPVDSVRFPALGNDQSFGRSPDQEGSFHYLQYPTPGSVNAQAVNNELQDGEASSDAPSILELLPNYPNPFNPSTQLQFRLTKASWVELSVYNAQGQKVREWPGRYFGPDFTRKHSMEKI